MFKFLATIYLIVALVTASFILNDYSDCYKMSWPNLTAGAMGAGYFSVFGGLLWPISLPGMLVLYDEKENRFCIN
ncbi:hypothetical protein LCGC14_1751200 [marine sediment metagenome]|uniref:Uncharacterized protein n=1 Tax=marine sediment metagenome TaxID=412755 RepID=A0A0F9JIU8_9ZZZZ